MRPYERTFRSLKAYSGQRNCFQLPFLHAGWLTKVVVIQTDDGPAQDFTVNIFNSHRPCRETGSASSGGEGNPASAANYSASPEAYKVLPEALQGAAGREAYYRDTTGHVFKNQDGDATHTPYFLYVEIDVGGPPQDGVETTWDITLGGYTGFSGV